MTEPSKGMMLLAETCGIMGGYRDAWENTIAISQETRRSLLNAMGFPCSDDDAVRASLERVRHLLTAQIAPRMVVIRQGKPLRIPVRIPAEHAGRALSFTLVTETGETHSGSRPLSRLPAEPFALDAHWINTVPTLSLPALPIGYHALHLEIPGTPLMADTTLAITPGHCYRPEESRQLTGLSFQMYGLRSRRDWGIGDFSCLADSLRLVHKEGYDFASIGPLHALFCADPNHFSPYAPSSRNLLNVLHIAIEDIPEFHQCPAAQDICASPAFRTALNAIRWESVVNYPAVCHLKAQALEALWDHFSKEHLAKGTARAAAFAAFIAESREKLELHGLFEALHEHFYLADGWKWHWKTWPLEYRSPDSRHVREFALQHKDRVQFFIWLQWLAHEQLLAAKKIAEDADMAVGLYGDFAVGIDPGGSVAWSQQEAVPTMACLGAPPDKLCPFGQIWGLSAFTPFGLTETGFAPFIAAMRESMRYFGALRMDHVMGLSRLFWVPEGKRANDGSYVSYPSRSLIGLIALESQRAKCTVIGEDLGTVEPAFRKELEQAGILSCRVLMLERSTAGRVPAPIKWKEQAVASLTTHDLPTCMGYWRGHDMIWRHMAGMLDDPATEKTLRHMRRKDKWAMLLALAREGLLPEGKTPRQLLSEFDESLPVLLHAFLARTPSMLHIITAEDALGLLEQPNLPGTFNEHPNWRRRLPVSVEDLMENGKLADFLDGVRRAARR